MIGVTCSSMPHSVQTTLVLRDYETGAGTPLRQVNVQPPSLQREHAGRHLPKNMREENQLRAAESLRDWSKWFIGVAIAAAAGRVIGLQGRKDRLARS